MLPRHDGSGSRHWRTHGCVLGQLRRFGLLGRLSTTLNDLGSHSDDVDAALMRPRLGEQLLQSCHLMRIGDWLGVAAESDGPAPSKMGSM